MESKKKLVELLRAARVTTGLYTSDEKLIETFEVPAVDYEVVEALADYLIENGVTVRKGGYT